MGTLTISVRLAKPKKVRNDWDEESSLVHRGVPWTQKGIVFVYCLWLVGAWSAQDDSSAEQEEAIAAIKKNERLRGIRRAAAGKPVIRVHPPSGGKTAGIGPGATSRKLTGKPSGSGLHLSDITEGRTLEHLKGIDQVRRLGLADTRLSDAGPPAAGRRI